jgi:hypothetical protein
MGWVELNYVKKLHYLHFGILRTGGFSGALTSKVLPSAMLLPVVGNKKNASLVSTDSMTFSPGFVRFMHRFSTETGERNDRLASSVLVHVLQIRRKTHNILFPKNKIGLTFMN